MGWKVIRLPDLKAKAREMQQAGEDFSESLCDDYIEELEKFVENWDDKPKFVKGSKKGKVFTTRVYPTGSIEAIQHFYWVNNGTGARGGGAAYDIEPKTETGFLSFRVGYVPKTTRKSYGGPGKATGPRVFTRKIEDHKGTAPRWFTRRAKTAVLKKRAKQYAKKIGKVLFRR